MDATLARRIDRLETRAALSELITRYGRAIDEKDIDALLSVFTDDAVLCSNGRELDATGHGGIRTLYEAVFKELGPSYHWWHGQMLDFDDADPDIARGEIPAHSETYRKGAQYLAALRYVDEYRRVGGTWKIARRELVFLYFCSMAEYADILGKDQRVTVYDSPRMADWPARLPHLPPHGRGPHGRG